MACTGCNGGCNDCGGLECGTGAAGLNGLNSFTTTTATFLQPAFGDPAVSVAVSALGQSTGLWGQVGQWIFIEGAGFFKVVTSTTTVLTVIVPTATIETYNYTLAANGATIAIGSGVSPAGIEGATGATGAASTVAGPIGPANPAVLEIDVSNIVTAQTTYASVQKSFSVPANTWETVDDLVRLEAMFVATLGSSGYYTIRIELDSNTIDMVITVNDLYILGKQNFVHITMDFPLTASGEITPILISNISVNGSYTNNQSGGIFSEYMRKCTTLTGLTTSGALDIDVSMVSSAGDNIKLFYYKLISMKK